MNDKFRVGKRYVADALLCLSEWREMMRYKQPVLIAHGTDDELVDIDMHVVLQRYFKC